MTTERRRRSARRGLAVASFIVATLGAGACAAPSDANGAGSAPAGQPPAAQELRVIHHEVPKRDFVGALPTEFRWSPIQEADRYAIGLWNETDRLMWRKDDITGPSVPMPKELYLDYGTYFWSVSALKNDREIAKSGMAAFVVEE